MSEQEEQNQNKTNRIDSNGMDKNVSMMILIGWHKLDIGTQHTIAKIETTAYTLVATWNNKKQQFVKVALMLPIKSYCLS